MSQQQKQYRIILIGDDCQDYYQYVTVDRISPEAPVPVCVNQYTEQKPGMAGNVKSNLENLGCHVKFYSGAMGSKTRIIDMRTNQHIIRLDNDVKGSTFNPNCLTYECDAVVLSDYNKGFLTYDAIQQIIKDSPVPVFIDTKKKDLVKFNGSFVKINQTEYENATSYPDDLIVTRGGNCIVHNGKRYEVQKQDVIDVCGAGDTFLASLAYKYIDSGSMDEAIKFAIKSSAITVQHIGVYAPSLKEIL